MDVVELPYYIGLAFLFVVALRLLVRILNGIKAHFFAPTVNFKDLGGWAVVTGSTDGIGKAFAEQLAKRGLNVFLLSRSAEKLKETAGEIEEQSKVQVKWAVADFSAPDIYTKIAEELKGLDVAVLVNNVGMGLEHPEFFQQIPSEVIQRMVNVNMLSVAMMTRIVLPSMIEKKKGVIINVSSASSILPPALLSVYAASKSFVNTFSEALAIECQEKGVIVQNVVPFFVSTKLSKMRAAFLVPRPTEFVTQSLKTVGHYTSTHGAIMHDLEGFFISFLPEIVRRHLTMGTLLSTRSRALKKKAAAVKSD